MHLGQEGKHFEKERGAGLGAGDVGEHVWNRIDKKNATKVAESTMERSGMGCSS